MTGTTTYYPAGGAMRVNGTLYFVLKDHLGSASVVTDSAGTIVGENRYYPFGETRLSTGTLYTDKLFTGQRNIAGLGIYHYQSRFYSPKLGRFLSADSLVPNPFNPQDYNRYSYVRNNPVRYTDPSGHRACITPEECADMGVTPGGGSPSKPRPQPCTRNCGGGGGRDNDTPDPNPNGLPAPVINPNLGDNAVNIPELSKDDDASLTPMPTTTPALSTETTQTTTQSSSEPNPGIQLLGVGLLLVMTVLELAILWGMVEAAPVAIAAPIIGGPGELGLLVLELAMINVSLVAVEMIETGSTNIEPLPLLPFLTPGPNNP